MVTPLPLTALDQRPHFFDGGLRFKCRQCGACCVGESGTIYVSPDEIMVIARHLNMTADAFIRQYCYPFKAGYSIGEDARGRCLFFNQGCTIYAVRPHQCRAFPFWFNNIRSLERWTAIGRHCPGIGSGCRYDREEIIAIARSTLHI